MRDGDKIPIYGYPGDGQVDELPFYIEIIGVVIEEIGSYTIRFKVNGQQIQGAWKLDNPEAVEKWESPGPNTYRILDRMTLPFDFQQNMDLNVVIIVDLPEGGESKSVKVNALGRNPVLALQSFYKIGENGVSMESTVSAEVPLSLLEIKDDMVIFDAEEKPGVLKYDSFEVETEQSSVVPQTQDRSLFVTHAEFPKEGLSNRGFPVPTRISLSASQEIQE